jgi:hypothetical protein
MWNDVFMAKVRDLTSRLRRPKKSKRSLLGETVEIASKIVAYSCVSNIVNRVMEYIDPNSNTHRIDNLKHNQEILKTQLEIVIDRTNEFSSKFNLTHEIQKGLINQLVGLSQIQRRQQQELSFLAESSPRISWISSYLQTKIQLAALDLQSVIEEYSRYNVACREMANLLGLEEIKAHDIEGTYFESIEILKPGILRFKFSIRARSETTFVYKVSAFKYWDHLTEIPTLMEYQGHRDIIYNHSNNCLKAIEEPQQDIVLETCEEANYTDTRLTIWQPLAKTRDIYEYKHLCQTKRTAVYNYIYCFPFDIITNLGRVKNPPHAYRLPLSVAFELPASNFRYTPVIRKLNITSPFEAPAIDSISISHFNLDSEAIDEVKWFDKMQALQVELQTLKTERNNTISIERHGGAFWSLIIFIVILTTTTVGLLVYRFYIDHAIQQEVVMDLRDIKSNYCEVKVDCDSCSHRRDPIVPIPPSITSKEDKQHIEVGNDSSINIILNRPLPEKPLKRTPSSHTLGS